MKKQFKLFKIIDDFIKKTNASWTRKQWNEFIDDIKKNNILINKEKLKKIIMKEKQLYLEKNRISKSKTIKLCRKFVYKNKANWNSDV